MYLGGNGTQERAYDIAEFAPRESDPPQRVSVRSPPPGRRTIGQCRSHRDTIRSDDPFLFRLRLTDNRPRELTMMTPFQQYAHDRWRRNFPEWSRWREDFEVEGEPDRINILYDIPSPANEANRLYVMFLHDEIMVKFAVPDSHEHYDPDLYLLAPANTSESEAWDQAYADALTEYIRPVLEDRMVAVRYDNRSALTSDVEQFATMNKILACRCESWTRKFQYPFPAID